MNVRAIIAVVVVNCAASAFGQPTPQEQVAAAKLRDQWVAAFSAGDWMKAEAALMKALEAQPDDFIARYNLASVQALQQKGEEAEASLKIAVESGFVDIRQISRDPNLASIRDTKTFRGIVANWRKVQDGVMDGRIAQLRNGFAKAYSVQKDEALRLAFVSGISAPALADARGEIARVSEFWAKSVLPKGTGVTASDEREPDPWVLVLLPTKVHYTAWAAKAFGARASFIGGIYDHDKKELVAQDIGATLRHEYAHVIHWRHCSRLGQVHPIWIQEGLCSLVEDVEMGEGVVTPVASWRTNMVKRMMSTGGLPKWSALFDKSANRFVQSRALGNYAAARSIFLFVHQRGKLQEWYTQYTQGFAADPTGARAMEAVFGQSLEQIEKDWRLWLKALPDVAEPERGETCALPVELEEGPDGLKVAIQDVSLDTPLTKAGLRIGDVVTSIDGAAVRDRQELARVLGKHRPGAQVSVGYRRGKVVGTAVMVVVEPG